MRSHSGRGLSEVIELTKCSIISAAAAFINFPARR